MTEGWVIDGLQIKNDELSLVFNTLFLETQSEKKRISLLSIILKIGSDFLPSFPYITHIVLTTWFAEQKFIQNYLKTIAKLSGGLAPYIDSLTDYRHLADLGSLLELVKQYDFAASCWGKVVKIKNDHFFGWMHLSNINLNTDNINEAILSLWNGVVNYNYEIPVGITKGKIDTNYRQDFETLLNSLQKKLKENYMISFIRGLVCQYFHKDTRSAINHFIKCLRLNPTIIEAQYHLIRLFGLVGDRRLQIETCERILKTDPTQKRALVHLARIYEQSKDFTQAVSIFEKLLEMDPRNDEWLIKLATLYRTSTLIVGNYSKKSWNRNLDKSYYYYKLLSKYHPRNFTQTKDYYQVLIELKKQEEAMEILLNHLAFEGHDKSMMRLLESVYLHLKLPFDEQKIIKETNYRREKDSAYPRILDFLSKVRSNIPVTLPRVAKFVNFPEERMEHLLKKLVEENPTLGEYLELEQVFIRKENTEALLQNLKQRYSTCYYCGNPIESIEATHCTSCEKTLLKCIVCKLSISFGEDVGQCSLCEAYAHLNHFEEWLKTQGTCPQCMQKLPVEGIIPISEPIKK
jgi:tetratricopeptide (TPR) repeat protein